MNTAIDDSNQRAALKAAIDARALARARLEAAAATLTRAQRISAAAQEQVEALEQAGADTESEQARQLEALITAGGPTLPAAIDASAVAALDSARLHASITDKALASLQLTHGESQTEVQAAEAVVKAAVEGLLSVEAEQLAAEIMRHEEQTLMLRARLAGLQEATPVAVSAAAMRALNPTPLTSLMPGPRYPYLPWVHGPLPAQIQAQRVVWHERIKALTAGEIEVRPGFEPAMY
jgi:hypothetical protein